jgi:LacI family transcriptional regulator
VAEDRLNVRQIAKLAGVSTATVSRVYRGVGAVSPQMRERVQAAIAEHNYRPSHLGEALANRRHGALGVVFPGLSGPYFAELIDGVESVAVEHRLSVHVIGTHLRGEAPDELIAMAHRVDGMAVHGGTVPAETLARLNELGPLVIIGDDPGQLPITVRTDNAAFRTLVDHLLDDHGRRSLAFVGNPDGSPDVTARWQSFLAAHDHAGVTPPADPIRVGLRQVDGVIAAEQVLAGSYDGVVCANDETAHGMLMAALGRGVSVPGDLVITGMDDVPLSALVRPALTTVSRPLTELGATAVRLLLDRIAGRDVPAETVLDSVLVRRASCGCRDDPALP